MTPDEFSSEPAPASADKQARAKTGYAKYAHLRANVKRRRAMYKLLIVLGILALAFVCVDIFLLQSALKLVSLGIFGVLLIWAIFMLISLPRHQEELADIDRLQRTLLQCPDCKNVFQYGEIHFDDHQKAAFTCPICGAYGALPDPGSSPVKAVVPEGDLKVKHYVCTNCREEIEVGTYGDQPLYDVRFRSCPRCGQSKFIQKKPESAPRAVNQM